MKIMKALRRRIDIDDPLAFDAYILNAPLSNARKQLYVDAYADYCDLKGYSFKRRKFQRVEKLPFIPQEHEIAHLIAAFQPKYVAFLQTSRMSWLSGFADMGTFFLSSISILSLFLDSSSFSYIG
jgi:hypothetical protein